MAKTRTVALVSGANRGIGLAIAAGLAREGLTVLLGCRDLGRGEAAGESLAAGGLRVRPVRLDTTDERGVAALAETIARDHGSLDILVNNAGIALDHDPTLSNVARLERTLGVNVVGMVRLTDAMLPLLRKSSRPRIINVSSELGSFGLREDPDWTYAHIAMPTYAASKAAVNALTVSYAKAFADDGIKVNAVCPGYTATESTNFAGHRTPEQAAVVAIRFALLDDDGPTGSFVNDAGQLPW